MRNKKLDKIGLEQVWAKIKEKFIGKNTILTTKEQIAANTSAENIAGALALKEAMADYKSQIDQIYSKLANASQIISESTTLTVGQTIIPAIDVRKYRYFIVAINWMYTPVTMKRYYSSTHDIIETSLTVCDSEIGVLRQVEFLINRSTGEINLKKWNQINLQSNSTWFIPNASGEGVGLYGLF